MSREEGQLLAQEESQETDAQVTEPPAPGDRGHGKARLFPTTAGGYCGAGLAGRPERGLQAAGRGSEEMESGPPPAMLSGGGQWCPGAEVLGTLGVGQPGFSVLSRRSCVTWGSS